MRASRHLWTASEVRLGTLDRTYLISWRLGRCKLAGSDFLRHERDDDVFAFFILLTLLGEDVLFYALVYVSRISSEN